MSHDTDAIEEMMSTYGTDVLKFLRFYSKDHNEAEDLLQLVFMRAYRSLPNFHYECASKTWLMRIAVNVCRNHARWKRRHPIISIDDIPELSHSHDGEQEIMKHLEEWELMKSVYNLPLKLKECILLHYFDGQSISEVSQTLSISENAVKQRLFRGRKRLENELGGEQLDRESTRTIATKS